MRKILFYALLGVAAGVAMTACHQVREGNRPDTKPQLSENRVPVAEAVASVNDFLRAIDPQTRGGQVRQISDIYAVRQNGSTRATFTRAEALDETDDPLFYILNFENDEGFAIVSADRRTEDDVYALTDHGYFDPEAEYQEEDVLGLKLFMIGVDNLIRDTTHILIPDPFEDPETGPTEIEIVDTKVYRYTFYGHRTNLLWHQGYPFNMFAPTRSGMDDNYPYNRYNGHTYAGATPVAVALLLAYDKTPSLWQGYSFNWDEMCRHMNSTESPLFFNTPYYTMIGRLVQQLSLPQFLNVDYHYGFNDFMSWFFGNSSDAPIENIPRTLSSIGYRNGGTVADYNTATVVSELLNCHPVIVSAFARKWVETTDPSDWVHDGYWAVTNHTWIIENIVVRGFKTTNITHNTKYIYCNWGYRGFGNGYFVSDIFDQMNGFDINAAVNNIPGVTLQPLTPAEEEDYNWTYTINIKMLKGIRK